MFVHTQEAFGKFVVHKIQNTELNTGFDIVPGYGANVLNIYFDGVSILDGYQDPMELDLNNWGKSILLFPFPNRLKDGRYSWQGENYQFPINDSYTENALHGLGTTKPMNVFKVLTSEKSGMISCQYIDSGETEYYPFPFQFSVSFEISAEGFSATMSVENLGENAIPMGFGWHPYFALSDKVDDCELHLPPLDMIGIDQRMIPTGKRYTFDDFQSPSPIGASVLDNCFIGKPEEGEDQIKIQLKGTKGTIDYWQEAGPGKFSYVQLFTPPARNSIAIEPMTCNVDAFNNQDGLINLPAGSTVEASFGFKFSKA